MTKVTHIDYTVILSQYIVWRKLVAVITKSVIRWVDEGIRQVELPNGRQNGRRRTIAV
jgi:hypothetical protein